MKATSRVVALAVAVVVAAAVLAVMHWRHVEFWLGMTNGSSPEYLAWSGWASDIAELTIFGAVAGLWHAHNCHQPGCWRVGKHKVDGSPWCTRHHLRARAAVAAVADTAPPFAAIESKMDKLSEDISDLADAIRSALLQGRKR